ncbi:MAG: 23S rRNA (guanosine(2251)-2'-O)-methyltransferase RlmB [Anaerolineales bacterium]
MSEWIVGRNPVYETLRANRRECHQLQIARGMDEDARVQGIMRLAAERNLALSRVERHVLNQRGENHQGVALKVGVYPYVDIDDILLQAVERDEPLLVLLLDVLKDPQNVGTLIRTAEAVGVHGVVLPYRRTATITPAVVSASSGACEHMLVTQANLAQTISLLKEEGVWVVGLEAGEGARSPAKIDLSGPMGVVVGSEGSGMRRLVKESCDFLMALPMRGKVDSLNASVAGSIALYLVWEARGYRGGRGA